MVTSSEEGKRSLTLEALVRRRIRQPGGRDLPQICDREVDVRTSRRGMEKLGSGELQRPRMGGSGAWMVMGSPLLLDDWGRTVDFWYWITWNVLASFLGRVNAPIFAWLHLQVVWRSFRSFTIFCAFNLLVRFKHIIWMRCNRILSSDFCCYSIIYSTAEISILNQWIICRGKGLHDLVLQGWISSWKLIHCLLVTTIWFEILKRYRIVFKRNLFKLLFEKWQAILVLAQFIQQKFLLFVKQDLQLFGYGQWFVVVIVIDISLCIFIFKSYLV